jgi:polar amino acid transport system substrate-binding protein
MLSMPSFGQQIRISTFEHETAKIDVSIIVMKKIYQRLGHELKIVRFPGKRALVEANNGGVDGELIRVKGVEKQLSNLVRIPVSIGTLQAMALTRAEDPVVVGMAGLLGKTAGILRGVEITERLTKNMARYMLNSIDSLFLSLLNERVDLILFPKFDAVEFIKSHQLEDKISMNKNPILSVALYHYIHKDKKALAEDMTKLLQQMKESGELDALIYSAEQSRRFLDSAQ